MKNHKDHRGSSGEERQRWHEWGVSEVIGVVLLLALVVVGGTVVGTQLLSQPTPKEIPNVNFLANYDSGQNYTTLYHTGGDTLRAGDYHFVVQYSGTSRPVTVKPTSDWQSGQRLPLPDASGEPYKVTLVYTGNGAGETALRSVVIGDLQSGNSGSSSGSTSTVTITPAETVAVTPTETVTITPTETVTITPTDTVTVTPTDTVTVTPTETVTITPTVTVTEDDEGFIIEGYVSNGIPTTKKPDWDETAPRLGGWTVQALVKGQAQNWSEIRSAVTNETGYYIMDHMPQDHYQVQLVLQPGWKQTYPTHPKVYDVTNLNHGHPDEWVYFMVQPTGSAGEGQILLNNPDNIGVMKDGTYIKFTNLGQWDWIKMASGTINIPQNSDVKIAMNGDQNTGKIYMSNGALSTYQFANVIVYLNGQQVASGEIKEIWMASTTNWQSTLAYVMGSYNSGAEFNVNKIPIINPPWWPYQDWGINVYGISPQDASNYATSPNVLNFDYNSENTYLVCSGSYVLFNS